MLEDVFFSLFEKKLDGAVHSVSGAKLSSDTSFDALYASRWVPFDGSSPVDLPVVSCDGSNAECKFTGGLGAYVARAVANICDEKGSIVDAVPDVDVVIGYRLEGTGLLMKALELRTLAAGIRKAKDGGKKVIGLFDGALYPTIAKELRHDEDLPLVKKLLESYIELYKLADEDTIILGVSKDSDITYARAAVIIDAIFRADRELADKLPMSLRVRDIAKALKGSAAEAGMLALGDDLSEGVSDESVFGHVAQAPGFSVPLLLPPQPRFIGEDAETKKWSWLNGPHGGFRAELKDAEVRKLLDELYSLSPVALTYWRSLNDGGTHRIDLLAAGLGYKGASGGLGDFRFAEELADKVKPVLAVLNTMAATSTFSIDPLIHADVSVKLDRTLFKAAYEPLILDALKKAGFDVDITRRELRDMVMRGY